MTQTDKATAKPWKDYVIDKRVLICRDLTGKQIASMDESDFDLDADIDNAGLIVRAVNSHDALVEACEATKEFFVKFEVMDPIKVAELMIKLGIALAKAKGE